MDSKYIQRKSVVKLPKTTGSISDTLNVEDKITNAPSINLVTQMTGIPTDGVIAIDSDEIPEGYEEVENPYEGGLSGGGAPIGSGMDYFGTVAPENYMFADGSAISRTEYAELFAIIGETYGAGDGSTTFNLPDKREAVSIMKSNDDVLGTMKGSNTQLIKKENLPNYTLYNSAHTHTQNAHNHSQNPHTHNATVNGAWSPGQPRRLKFEESNSTAWLGSVVDSTTATNNATTATNQSTTITVNSGGSDTPISVMQKSLVCNYIIKVK